MPRTFRRPVDLLVMIWRTPNANLLRHTNSPDDEIFMINDINIYYKTLIIYDRFIAKILQPFLKKQRRGKRTKKNKQQNYFNTKILLTSKLKSTSNINAATNFIFCDYAKM